MIEFLRGLKKFSVATIIVSAILGVLFIAFPDKCIEYTSLFVGISFIVIGAISIVGYVIQRDAVMPLILGIISLVSGIVVCVKYRAIISFVVVVFGIFILTSGFVDLATSIRSLVLLRKSGWFTLMLSIITIIFGIIAITKSAQLTDSIVRFIGVALIVYSVLDLATLLQINHLAQKNINKVASSSDIEVDATEIE